MYLDELETNVRHSSGCASAEDGDQHEWNPQPVEELDLLQVELWEALGYVSASR